MLAEAATTYLTVRIGDFNFAPQYTAVLVAAMAAALLSALKLWRIASHENRQVRLDALREAVGAQPGTAQSQRRHWYQRLGSVVAVSPIVGRSEQQRLLRALAATGFRQRGSLAIFVTIKVCSALALAALFWALVEWQQLLAGSTIFRMAVLVGGLMLGWRLPEIVLSRMAARRRVKIEQGLPDALDLLVI